MTGDQRIPEGVPFDLDGTLIDNIGVYCKLVDLTLGRLGFYRQICCF